MDLPICVLTKEVSFLSKNIESRLLPIERSFFWFCQGPRAHVEKRMNITILEDALSIGNLIVSIRYLLDRKNTSLVSKFCPLNKNSKNVPFGNKL